MKQQIKTLIMAPVLLCSSLLGDEGSPTKKEALPFEEGRELIASQAPAIYNYPTRVKTESGWDTFATASFLYWNVFQEGMELGTLFTPAASAAYGNPSGILEFPSEYKSGFRVELGWNTPFDDWALFLGYTWFHHAVYQKQPASLVLSPNFYINGNNVNSLSSTIHRWTIGLDRVDMLLSRPCYQGKRLTITPSFGLTGVFLDQRYQAQGVIAFGSDSLLGEPIATYVKTDSWAVGPSAGLEGRFLLGEGFRLVGSLSGALTFTRYNGIQYFASGSLTTDDSDLTIRGSDENRVRAICDAEAGFGWGMYLCNQKYHIDFSATYEFQVFWNQNMLNWFTNRVNLSNITNSSNGSSPGNLYFQGLTVSGTFDF